MIVSKFEGTKQELVIDSHNVEYSYPVDDEPMRITFSDGRWHVSAFNDALKVSML